MFHIQIETQCIQMFHIQIDAISDAMPKNISILQLPLSISTRRRMLRRMYKRKKGDPKGTGIIQVDILRIGNS